MPKRFIDDAYVIVRMSLYSQYLEESSCHAALLKMKVAFSKHLGFVEALPDSNCAKKLSGFPSWNKVVWKYGQLKKKKKGMGSSVHI